MAPRACAVRWKGYGGLLAAGFWGNAWEYQPYLSYSVTSDPLLPTTPQGGSCMQLCMCWLLVRVRVVAAQTRYPCGFPACPSYTPSRCICGPTILHVCMAAKGASGHSVSGSVKAVGWAALGAFLGAGAVAALVLVRDRRRQHRMGTGQLGDFYSASIN